MNIIAPLNQLGYGLAALNIIKHLPKDTALWTIGNIQIDEKHVDIIKQFLRNAQMFNPNAPCVKIWHQNDMAQFVGRGKRIAFPFFELDCFSPVEKHHLNSVDEIMVTSGWAKKVCEKELKIPDSNIKIAHLGVDSNIFKPLESKNTNTVFLNCGKWEVRKGHDFIVKVFNDAFTESDNVELWMMCDNPFLTEQQQQQWESLYKKSKLGDKINIIHRKHSHQHVYDIMSQADCGLFPSRAEGWNLELLEMMACGKHVIATFYSAHTEFCNNLNAHLIEIKDIEIAYDGFWFKSNVGSWAKIDKEQIDQTVHYMRKIHNDKQNGTLKLNIEGVKTANKFTWENSAKMVINNV